MDRGIAKTKFGRQRVIVNVGTAALAVVCLSACDSDVVHFGKSSAPIGDLNVTNVIDADPVLDLETAIRKNDVRFVGVHGFADDVPGVSRRPDAVNRFDVKYIEGTSDTIALNTQVQAENYAETYNILLLRYLISHGRIPPSLKSSWPDSSNR